MKRFWLCVAVLVGGLSLSGCASPPELRYFTLGSDEQVVEKRQEPLYVARVQVPEYLDDNRIWVRPEPHRIEALPHVRWAERLPRAITRSLQNQFGTGVAEASEGPRLLVDIQRFEAVWDGGDKGARVVLRAAWRIGDGDARSVTFKANAPDREASTLVKVMSNQVGQLAKAIAEQSLRG
ncbi:putative lipoprotein YmbA [Halospina denitrificans]|uniref:Putative lipoprotein YmbA n=1 Tax=Halospina denitrificans TaxID=332522 RepID=A0A4R7K233_9GAMM|nr:PqiC family protein [Halospina denitrificans]TDT43983.1 putative lipoprotein YmbA [Halospina denitrificans]